MFVLPDGFSWIAPLNDGASLDLDLTKNGDEWIDFVFRRLGATTGSTGYQMAAHQSAPGGHIYRLSGAQNRTALWVLFPVGGGPICYVLGDGQPLEKDVEEWHDAVTHAIGQIGTVTDFGWWTVIGVDPYSIGGAALRLNEPTAVAGLKLHPAPNLFFENAPGRFNVFQGNCRHSGLVKVTGKSRGYTWGVAAEDAAKRVRLFCSMLSVSSGAPWIQRSAVNPLVRVNEHGEDEPTSGDGIDLPAKSPWERDELVMSADEVQVNTIEVPDWIEARWDAITRDERLTHALLNHHEGLLMMPNHPSHAALAFVTTIEALGNWKEKKLPRCPHCKVVIGSGERFRGALAQVLPADEADKLGRKFYGWRSRTAHDGVLHGTEPTFGAWTHWGGISANAVHDFGIEIYGLAAAARRLLLLVAGGVEVPQSSLR